MMLLTALLGFLSFVWGMAPLHAAFRSTDKGTCSGQFLKLGVGARAMGMGEAFSSVADDATAIYWNPGALTRLERRSAAFMHALLIDTVVYDYLAYGQRISKGAVIGAGIQSLSVGTVKETDASGFETGTRLSPGDFAFSFGFAQEVEEFGLGLGAKYIRSELAKSDSAMAMDAGVLSPGLVGGNLRFSFAIQNIGGGLRMDQDLNPLPLMVRVGSSLLAENNWTISFDMNFPKDNRPCLALGTEYGVSIGSICDFSARLGFNSRTIGDVSGFTGLTSGVGIGLRGFKFDYAFVPIGSIGLNHYFSISAAF